MKVVEGGLTQLGASTISANGWTNFSTIEIGEQVLSNIGCRTSLANFLHRALEQSGSTKLYISKANLGFQNQIAAIELPDGKKYSLSFSLVGILFYLIVGIPITFFLIGFFFVIPAFMQFKDRPILLELQSKGAIILE
jgi:hypothetical protein